MHSRSAMLLPDAHYRCCVAPRLFLGLDYDGTLVPIAARPEEARPSPAVLTLLSQLVHLPSVSVAVLSGRPINELRTLLPVPGLIYVGTHGLETSTARGHTHRLVPPGAFMAVIASLRREITARVRGCPGIGIEDKQQALALHYRLAKPSDSAHAVSSFLATVTAYQRRGFTLETVHGKQVVEVRPHGVNKGRALQYLLQQEGKDTVPVYIGDDTTDEDAFRVLRGHGVTIAVSDPPRPSAAQYALLSAEEVVQFLTAVLTARCA